MAVLLPLSLSLLHPTHLSPFRFRGFINIASLQGRSVHPLGIPVCLCSLFFFKHNCIFKNINKWSTICDSIISPISIELAGSDLGNPVPLIYGESQAVCGNSFAFQTSPHLDSPLSYLITRPGEMKEGHKVTPCHRRTLTSPLETKQNRTASDTIVSQQLLSLVHSLRVCVQMAESAWVWILICKWLTATFRFFYHRIVKQEDQFQYHARWLSLSWEHSVCAKLYSPLKMCECIMVK